HSKITHTLIDTEITSVLARRKLYKDISELKNHYILCGAGRVGSRVVDELRKKEVDFIVIEHDEHVADRLLTRRDSVLAGAATDAPAPEAANLPPPPRLLAPA